MNIRSRTPHSRPISKPRKKSPDSCVCAISPALSSSTSSTWKRAATIAPSRSGSRIVCGMIGRESKSAAFLPSAYWRCRGSACAPAFSNRRRRFARSARAAGTCGPRLRSRCTSCARSRISCSKGRHPPPDDPHPHVRRALHPQPEARAPFRTRAALRAEHHRRRRRDDHQRPAFHRRARRGGRVSRTAVDVDPRRPRFSRNTRIRKRSRNRSLPRTRSRRTRRSRSPKRPSSASRPLTASRPNGSPRGARVA